MATYYVDNTKSSGTLTGTWTFTNASTSVTASGGDAQTELADGDYIRQSDGTQWYKVNGEPGDADTITITPAFQQATHTDDVGASLYNAEAGTATGTAHAHPQQSVDVPPANGESVILRANQTHLVGGTQLNLSGVDGGLNQNNVLVGADSVLDPWSDVSDVKPIIDGEGASTFIITSTTGDYWEIRNLEVKDATNTCIDIDSCNFVWIDKCKVTDSAATGINIEDTDALITDTELFDNTTRNILARNESHVQIDGCTLNGGAGGTAQGVGILTAAYCEIKNTTFGSTTEHSSFDVNATNGNFRLHNVALDSTTQYSVFSVTKPLAVGRFGDDGQTRNGYGKPSLAGVVAYSTVVNRGGAGGTAWSMLGEPSSSCGVSIPMYVIGEWLAGFPLYLDGTAQTITVYMYVDSTAGGWTPNASELYMEIEHEQSAGVWAKDVSVDTIAAEDQWESYSITLTPNTAGLAYLRVILKDTVAGGKVYVDPTPVIS